MKNVFIMLGLIGLGIVIGLLIPPGLVWLDEQTAQPPQSANRVVPEGDWLACDEDSDCVLAPQCCGCGGAGEQLAINNNYSVAFNDLLDNECTGRTCLAVMSNHPSCSQRRYAPLASANSSNAIFDRGWRFYRVLIMLLGI